MKRPLLRIALLLVVLTSTWGGYYYSRYQQPPTDTPTGAVVADAIPKLLATPLLDLTGQKRTLAEWRGKILVINLWATWCTPCKDEMPAFSLIHQQLAGNDVQFIGIALDTAEAVRAFSSRYPVSYPLLLGETELGALSTQLGNRLQGLPFTLILDRNGQAVASRLGRWPEDHLREQLQSLLVAGK